MGTSQCAVCPNTGSTYGYVSCCHFPSHVSCMSGTEVMPAACCLLQGVETTPPWNMRTFSASVAVVLAALLVALGCLTDYSVLQANDKHVQQYYMYYIHVAMMVFVGFGFLMTFLYRYSYSAVGLNFFASSVVMLEFIVVGGAVQQVRSLRGCVQYVPCNQDLGT
jgi:hypothetical protein